jgi:hypothetical protein
LLECTLIDIDADENVPLGVVLRQRTCSAPKVEDAQIRAADELGDQPGAVVGAEHKFLATAVVFVIPLVEAFKPGHLLAIFAHAGDA